MHSRILKGGLVAGIVFLAACSGDGTGSNGTELSAEERQALTSALTTNGAIDGEAAAFAGIVYAQLTEYGSMSATTSANVAAQLAKGMSASIASRADEYDAFGVQLKYTVTYDGESYSGVVTGVYGWAGLNTSANTVDELIYVGHFSTGSDFENSFSAEIGGGPDSESYTSGGYYSRTDGAYAATEGEFTLTGASFGGGDDCSTDYQGISYECQMSFGNLEGGFNFTAQNAGGATTDHSIASFDLPAVRMEMTMDASDFEQLKARK